MVRSLTHDLFVLCRDHSLDVPIGGEEGHAQNITEDEDDHEATPGGKLPVNSFSSQFLTDSVKGSLMAQSI